MTKWLEIAWHEVGVAEVPGTEANPRIVAYFADAGRPDVLADETHWCAAFVGACLSIAGVPLDGIPRHERLLARAYLRIGTVIEDARVGAVAVFARGGNPQAGHVAFVTGWTDSHLKVLGGNQANKVCEIWMPRADLIGLRWPAAPLSATDIAAAGSRIATAALRAERDAIRTGLAVTGTAISAAAPAAAPDLGTIAAGAAKLKTSIEQLQDFALYAVHHAWWIAAGLAAYSILRLIWGSHLIASWRAQDSNTGKTG